MPQDEDNSAQAGEPFGEDSAGEDSAGKSVGKESGSEGPAGEGPAGESFRKDLDEATVEELLRSLEEELKESGEFPMDESFQEADAEEDLDDEDEDAGAGSEVVFGLSADINPQELFGELSKVFGKLAEGGGQLGSLFNSYESAKQLAIKVARGDTPEPAVEPTSRIRLEELFKVAEMYVNSAEGLSLETTGNKSDVLTRTEWVSNILKDSLPLFSPDSREEISVDNPMSLVQNLMLELSSTARLMEISRQLGELSHTAFGYYFLPIPPPARKTKRPIGIVLPNIERFSKEWSLDFDQAGLLVCVTEILSDAILSKPGVRDTLRQLYENYVAEIDDSAAYEWEEKLKEFENPMINDPTELLGSLIGDTGEIAIQFSETEEQLEISRHISAIATAVIGHVQYLTEKVTTGLVGPGANLSEAFRRQQLKIKETSDFGRQILGIVMDLDQGREFISELDLLGGAEALEKLWSSESSLPTPAEIESPRLWLARMELL